MTKIFGEIVNSSSVFRVELISDEVVLVEIASKRLEVDEENYIATKDSG